MLLIHPWRVKPRALRGGSGGNAVPQGMLFSMPSVMAFVMPFVGRQRRRRTITHHAAPSHTMPHHHTRSLAGQAEEGRDGEIFVQGFPVDTGGVGGVGGGRPSPPGSSPRRRGGGRGVAR